MFTFLPLGDASVCSEKMAAVGEKLFCVLEYHTSKYVATVQCEFRAKYAKIFVPLLPCDLADLNARIIAAVTVSQFVCTLAPTKIHRSEIF